MLDATVDCSDVAARDQPGLLGGRGHGGHHRLRRRALFVGRARDLAYHPGELADARHDFLQTGDSRLRQRVAVVGDAQAVAGRRHGILRDFLQGLDDGGDVGRGLGRPIGQVANLLRDDGEAAAGVSGARRFDRGVERQQIRALGDQVDGIDDGADLARPLPHLAHDRGRLHHRLPQPPDPLNRSLNDRASLLGVAGDAAGHLVAAPAERGDRLARPLHLLSRGRGRVRGFGNAPAVFGDRLHGPRHLLDRCRVLLDRPRQALGHRADFLDRRCHLVDRGRGLLRRHREIAGVVGDGGDRARHFFDRRRRLGHRARELVGVAAHRLGRRRHLRDRRRHLLGRGRHAFASCHAPTGWRRWFQWPTQPFRSPSSPGRPCSPTPLRSSPTAR